MESDTERLKEHAAGMGTGTTRERAHSMLTEKWNGSGGQVFRGSITARQRRVRWARTPISMSSTVCGARLKRPRKVNAILGKGTRTHKRHGYCAREWTNTSEPSDTLWGAGAHRISALYALVQCNHVDESAARRGAVHFTATFATVMFGRSVRRRHVLLLCAT